MATTQTQKSTLKTIHISFGNRPGELATATRALANAGVNIEAIESEILGSHAFLRFFTKDAAEAEATLRKHRYVVTLSEVVEVDLENKPGEVARVCETLAAADVNIESCFGSAWGPNKETRIYLRVNDSAKAHKVLIAARIRSHRHER